MRKNRIMRGWNQCDNSDFREKLKSICNPGDIPLELLKNRSRIMLEELTHLTNLLRD